MNRSISMLSYLIALTSLALVCGCKPSMTGGIAEKVVSFAVKEGIKQCMKSKTKQSSESPSDRNGGSIEPDGATANAHDGSSHAVVTAGWTNESGPAFGSQPQSGWNDRAAFPRRDEKTGGASAAFTGILNADQEGHPRQMAAPGGVIIRVEDTDDDPPSADLEIDIGGETLEYEEVETGRPITIVTGNGGRMELVIDQVNEESGTVWFSVRPMP